MTGGCLLEMRGAFFPAALVMPLRRPDRARICDQKHGVAMQGAAACGRDAQGRDLGEWRDFVEVSDFEYVAPLTASVITPRAGPPGTRILLTGFRLDIHLITIWS